MSNEPDSKFDLDLHFLPAWAQQSPDVNRFANFEGDTDGRFDRSRPGRGGPRRDRPDRGPRRDQPGDARRGPPREQGGGFARRQGGGRGFGPGRGPSMERREPAIALPEMEVTLVPEDKGVEALARQIKLTGRAYPLFDIGFLILKKPERYNVRFNVVKKADGTIAQPLFICSLDETLWLSDQEAMNYVLDRHFATFYQADKIPAEPPKGVFTFVGQCGMSGVIFGPPNYHDYQNKLRKLHAERYSHLPFEAYKARVKIVRDEATVKKWLEDQSFTTEFTCLNVPDTIKLGSREEVERHFRATHLSNVIQAVESYTLNGAVARSLPCPALQAAVRHAWDDQRRFPLKLVTTLSQMFASQGLQFFKVNKTLTHVAVSRPHFLDLNVTPVSDGIKQIISFINSSPGCSRRSLVEALAPPAPVAPAPAVDGASAPAAPSTVAGEPNAAPAPSNGQPASEGIEQSPEANAVISDLHWLIHQGHVIEFANGTLETAKAPAPKPPRPAPRPLPSAASTPAAQTVEPASDAGSASPPIGEVAAGPPSAEPLPESSEAESTAPPEAEAAMPEPVSPEIPESKPTAEIPVSECPSGTSAPTPV